ncbi:hypothetical protein GGF46_003465 [Coemansia sp. RSA 552]|nr:hypothetical protein GGF46_003465 [Coemansia sp. RSA 552]
MLLRSCENCRRKKRKCSGDHPACVRCKAQGETCTYRPTARFLKPRQGGGSGSGAVRKSPYTKRKKRASIASTQSPQLHDPAMPGMGSRPRALSVVAAALKNAHHRHMGASPLNVTALAPADLMLSPPLTVTPAGLSPGSVSTSDFADALDPLSRPGMVAASGLAYMSPTAATTPLRSASGSGFPDDGSTNASSPQLLLSTGNSLAGPPPAAAMGTPQQQFMYSQGLVGANTAAAAAAMAAVATAVSQAPPAFYDAAEYSRLLASAITQEQAASALMSSVSPSAANMPAFQRQPAATSLPREQSMAPYTANVPYSFGTQPQPTAFSAWPQQQPPPPPLPQQQPLTDPLGFGGVSVEMASVSLSPHVLLASASEGFTAAGSATALDAILPQSKNIFAEWFVQ